MNNGEPSQAEISRHSLARLWFGTSLAQFLQAELKDFPERRVAAFRLFLVSLTIVLVSQSLHVPPFGAIALLICLSYDAYANAGQSLLFGLRQLGYLMVTTVLSILTLMVAGNEPWLLLCLSFSILALALFHARLSAWPTGIALWYAIVVLYSPSTPQANVYQALWTVPIIGVLALGIWTVVHLTIKPQDPLKLLKAGITAQLASVEHIFSERLAASGLPSYQPTIPPHNTTGGLGKLLGLLSNAELIHPGMRQYHETYTALLLEIDGLHQLADWLAQILPAEYRAQTLTQQKLNVYLALQSACAKLREGEGGHHTLSRQMNDLLSEDVLLSYSGTNASILTALWRALQRIAVLMQDLQQTPLPTTANRLAAEPAVDQGSQVLPAWFGYEFWATHADSLQFGLKFSLGAILCTLIVQGLNWPDINTAIPTCLVAAQTSLGADYRLSLLRVSGAALGGLCAYAYVMVFQSQLDTIVGFAFATAPFWALAAWITAGSERIAYLGRQLGFSFALFVMHDFGPVTDLYLPRDRIIGILLGLLVMGLLDYALWPRRSVVLARHHCVTALKTLAKLSSRPLDAGHLLKRTLPVRLAAEKELAAAHDLLAHAVLEPDARLLAKAHERTALRAIIRDASHLSGLMQIRKRYRLLSGQQFSQFPETLQFLSRAFDTSLATALENTAQVLQGEQQENRASLAENQQNLEQSYSTYHAIDNLPADLAMEWALRFRLDRQIVTLIEKIETSALKSIAASSSGS